MSPRERMAAVTQRWFLVEPLLFAVWTTHDLAPAPRLRTLRVGRGRIEYNPSFIEGLNRFQLETVMRAEAVRILLKHPYSRCKSDRVRSYRASNLTLQELLNTDLPWPRARDLFGTDCYDRQYFEFYYQLLGESRAWVCPSSLYGDYANAPLVGGENALEWDADELLSDRIDERVDQARQSNNWGTVAGDVREQVLANLTPPLDYRAILSFFRATILSSERRLTRMKPSRRYGFRSLGSRYEFTTRLLAAVDVSGSISREDLCHGFSVINRFFCYGIRSLDVVCFDTEIKGEALTLTRARRKIQVTGRGGTDLSAPMKYIDEHRDYDGVIVFTDGIAPFPSARKTGTPASYGSSIAAKTIACAPRPCGPSGPPSFSSPPRASQSWENHPSAGATASIRPTRVQPLAARPPPGRPGRLLARRGQLPAPRVPLPAQRVPLAAAPALATCPAFRH